MKKIEYIKPELVEVMVDKVLLMEGQSDDEGEVMSLSNDVKFQPQYKPNVNELYENKFKE